MRLFAGRSCCSFENSSITVESVARGFPRERHPSKALATSFAQECDHPLDRAFMIPQMSPPHSRSIRARKHSSAACYRYASHRFCAGRRFAIAARGDVCSHLGLAINMGTSCGIVPTTAFCVVTVVTGVSTTFAAVTTMPFFGTAQESDEGCILGGFLENDDFSLSGRPNIRFRRKWAEFAALRWKWRAEGGRAE